MAAASSKRNMGQYFRGEMDNIDCQSLAMRLMRRGKSRKETARSIRSVFEAMETRQLMSVIPAPEIADWQSLSGTSTTDASMYNTAPSTAVDPTNPNRAVTVFTHNYPGASGDQKVFIDYTYTNDGGVTWQGPAAMPGNLPDPLLTTTTVHPFAQATDATVSFGRDGSFYVGYSEHNAGNSAGALILQGFNWTAGSAPVGLPAVTNKVVYRWVISDSAWTPTLAVDNNVASYTDPVTGFTQNDPFSGTIYIAWATNDVNSTTSPAPINNFNPNTIRVVSAVWDDPTLKTDLYLSSPEIWNTNKHDDGAHAVTPKIVISQGSLDPSTGNQIVAGGQVTVVWDDITTGRSTPVDNINVSTSTQGGGAYYLDENTNKTITDAQLQYLKYPANAGTGQNITSTALFSATKADGVTLGDFDGDSIPDAVVFNNANSSRVITFLKGNADGTFSIQQPQLPYPAGMGTVTGIMSGLFDAGGSRDIVLIDSTGAWVFSGNGDGTFAAPPGPTIAQPFLKAGVAVDLDNDGLTDMVLVDTVNKNLYVEMNAGGGVFNATVVSMGSVVPNAVVASDFDGDGNIDLVVLDKVANAITFIPGTGPGTFGAPAAPILLAGSGIINPTAIIAGASSDFDEDGNIDLVVLDAAGAWILTGNGDGTFNIPAQANIARAGLTSGDVADLDRDGDPDLVLADTTKLELVGALNHGTNTNFVTSTVSTGIESPRGVTLGDFDGDSIQDMVVLDSTTKTLSFRQGVGDGTFGAVTGTINLAAAGLLAPTAVVTGDFDGDTNLDVIVIDSQGAWLFTGNGDGTFNVPASVTIPQAGLSAAAVGDLDGDGSPDLVITDPSHKQVFIAINDGSGSFSMSTLSTGTTTPNVVAIGDFDADGNEDAMVFDTIGSARMLLTGDGSGGLTAGARLPMGNEGVSHPVAATSADIDGDGFDDMIFADARGIWVYYNVGGLGLVVPTVHGPAVAATGITSLSVGDVDGDTDIDIVGSDVAGNQVVVALTNGTGLNFTTISNSSSTASAVVSDDFDGGKADVVVLNTETASLSFLHGNGDGTLRTTPTIPSISLGYYGMINPRYMAAGDFNNDNNKDLMIVDDIGVWEVLGNGDGTFQAPQLLFKQNGLGRIYTTDSSAAQAVGSNTYVDFDGDNKTDFVVIDPVNNKVIVGLSAANWAAVSYNTGGTTPIAAAIGDVNKDNRPDIVVANNGDGSVGFLINQGLGVFLNPSALTNTILNTANGADLQDIAIGDVDAAGEPDVVVLGDHQLFTFFNRYNGGFVFNPTPVVTNGLNVAGGVQEHYQSLRLTNLDGLGGLDVVIANRGTNSASGSPLDDDYVLFMTGNNSGSFARRDPVLGEFATGTAPNQASSLPGWITLEDLDGNGQLDVVVVNAAEQTATVLLRVTTPFAVSIPTTVTLDVEVTDLNFSLSDVAVDIGVIHPATAELLITLTAPNGHTVTLMQNRLLSDGTVRDWPGTTIPMGTSVADLGYQVVGTSANFVGLTFGNGVRNINDSGFTGVGTYLPEGNVRQSNETLFQLLGYDLGGTFNGLWTLSVTDEVPTDPQPPQYISHFGVRLTSNTQATGQDFVASTGVLGGLNPLANGMGSSASGATGIGPGIQLAQDNTLGSFSAHQGRIYVTFVNRSGATGNESDNTDVMLVYSDDGGLTWGPTRNNILVPIRVNDDNGLTDGYSGASVPSATSTNQTTTRGRPQFQPAIAVDQLTGTLVITYFDARQDASGTRVARYIATSIDGGDTFGPATFLNLPSTAVDATTGKTIVLGPTPDNGSSNDDPNWGAGYEQGLAVMGGTVYATWSGNTNGTVVNKNADGTYTLLVNNKHLPDILSAVTHITAGPRVVSGTMGPVSQPGDLLNPAADDGTPTLSSFIITFDRLIDLSTVFTTGANQNIWVYFRAPGASGNAAGTAILLNAIVVPVDPDTHVEIYDPAQGYAGVWVTAIRVDFVTPQTAPGTYSYYVEPTISDQIRKAPDVTLLHSGHRTITYSSDAANSNLAIPSVGTGGAGTNDDLTTSTITTPEIPTAEAISDLVIKVNIQHTNVANLKLTLIDPSGNSYILRQFSGSGRNITGTYTASIPASTVDNLTALLLGLNNGTILRVGGWKLEVDDGQASDTGFLLNWNLTFTTSVSDSANGNGMDQDGDGIGGESAWTGQSLGDDYAAPGATQANGWDATTHTFQTPYSSTTLPLIVPGTSVTTSDRTYNMTGPSVLIPDATGPNPADYGKPTTPPTITIDSAPDQVIDSITVQLEIKHSALDTLNVYLVAPDGTKVLLMKADPTRRTPIDGSLGPVTVFDDSAKVSITAPKSLSYKGVTDGMFQPAGAQVAGNGLSLLNGMKVDGDWKLQIEDTQPDGITNATLESWSITVNTSTVIVNPAESSGTQPTVGSVVVTFDRAMNSAQLTTPGSIAGTSSPVMRVVGPAGPIDFAPTYKSTDTPKNIPDTNSPILSSINVTDTYPVGHVSVKFDISHLNVGDLRIVLIDPDGGTHVLVTNRGGTGDNFTGTVIDELSTTLLSAGSAPFSAGAGYKPEAPLDSTLANLMHGVKGTWTLQVTDSNGNAIAGTLNSWSMTVTPRIEEVTAGDTAYNPLYAGRMYRFFIPNQAASGQYGFTLNPLLKDADGNTLDSNHDAGVDALRDALVSSSAGATPTVTIPYVYNQNIGVTIPVAIDASTPSITTSVLTVKDDFTLQGVTARLNLSFASDTSLDIILVSPSGQQVTLFTHGLGNFGTKTNFLNTVFDDAATTPVQNGSAPYTGRFNPQNPLADFVNTGLGYNVAGDWTLIIKNYSLTTTPGTLNNWSITAAKAVETTGMGGISDQATVNFRIFNLAAGNTQSSNTWTPVTGSTTSQGSTPTSITPTPTTYSTLTAGSITDVAVDPSDPSGNTVFVATASGGIWKTTNFLTADPQGPIYTPITDFGAINSLNIGSLAVFARNAQPATTGQLSGNVIANVSSNPSDPAASSPSTFGLNPTNATDGSLTSYWSSTTLNNATLVYDLGSAEYVTSVKYAPRPSLANLSYGNLMVGGKFQGSNNPSGGWTDLYTITTAPLSGTLTTGAVSTPGNYRYVRYVGPASSVVNGVTINPYGTIGEMQVFGSASNTVSTGSSNQTVVIAGTGQGDAGNSPTSSTPTLVSQGVGFLLSTDGGANWTLLDSLVNVDASGNWLPTNSPARLHDFVGNSTFKVVVDPHPTATGDVIIYAAMTGPKGGLYRSVDTGKHWTLMRAGDVTDIILDYNSGTVNSLTNPTGNLNIIYAGFRGDGIYQSPNRGVTWNQMLGSAGGATLLRDGTIPGQPLLTEGSSPNPNGNNGRIILAMPSPTGDKASDALHEGWLYAGVVTADASDYSGQLSGLYVTKDFGQNWTKISLDQLNATTEVPTNDSSTGATFNMVDGTGLPGGAGNYAFSIAVDPNNPAVVYVGGVGKAVGFGITRVDTTHLYDAHSFYTPLDAKDGGKLTMDVTAAVITDHLDGISVRNPFGSNTSATFPGPQYLNLVTDPLNPFVNNSTYIVENGSGFVNSGFDAYWRPADTLFSVPVESIRPSAQRVITMIDPITGLTRILYATDTGLFSAVTNADGTLASDVGSVSLANGSRSGNIDAAQVIQGAAQPGSLAAQLAGALFYGMTNTNGVIVTDPNGLATGDTTGSTNFNGAYGGTGVATDGTGSGTAYVNLIPGFSASDFFQVFGPGASTGNLGGVTGTANNNTGGVGRTFGLINNTNAPAPAGDTGDSDWPDSLSFNFAVNPINGNQIVMGSLTGAVYATYNQGVFWSRIGTGADLDSSMINTFAYGAPDQNAGDSTSFMIYAGTSGIISQVTGQTTPTGNGRGQVFVTFTGGGNNGNGWLSLDPAGLDGSPVKSIVTNPARGSHELYVTTEKGEYWMADSSVANPKWTNITGNLPSLSTTAIWTSTLADWRYQLPSTSGGTHPVLYIGGDNGVYRSLDNGATWKAFPSQDPTLDSAIVDGGYLPHAQVTDLDFAIGNVNPDTGATDVSTGPSILLASTYGRGQFAIRIAPLITQAKFGADSGGNRTLTGMSQINAYGNQMSFKVYDMSNPSNPVDITASEVVGGTSRDFTPTDGSGTIHTVIPDTLNADGTFSVSVSGGYSATALAIQAYDAAGVAGPLTTLLVPPTTPASPDLQAASDSGTSSTDNLTNVRKPTIDDGGVIVGAGNTVTIYSNGVSLGTTVANGSGHWAFTFPANLADGTYNITVTQTDSQNQTSAQSPVLAIVIDGTPPAGTPKSLPAIAFGASLTNVAVATFTDASPIVSSIIDWNDGTTTSGTLTLSGGVWTVTGTHTYGSAANYTIKVSATDKAGNTSAIVNTSQSVTPPAFAFSITPQTFNTNEAQVFNGRVGIVTDANPSHLPGNLTATIDWGDGIATFGTVVVHTDSQTPGQFDVVGTHTYADNRPGSAPYDVTVAVTTNDGKFDTKTSHGNVADVHPTPVITGTSEAFVGQTGTYTVSATDPSGIDTSAGFGYVVNWGDGTTTTVNATAGNGSGVGLSHTFGAPSTGISVTATDKDGVSGNGAGALDVEVLSPPALGGTPTINGVPAISGKSIQSDIGLIQFTVTNTSFIGGISLSDLKLLYNGNAANPLSLNGATFTFDAATGLASLDLSHITTPLADGDYQLQVTAGPKVLFLSFVKLQGDLNGDGIVNAKDQALLKSSLGKTPGQAGYVRGADLNHDGVVNAADTALMVKLLNHKASAAKQTILLQTGKAPKVPTINFGAVKAKTNGGYVDLVIKNANVNGVMIDIGKLTLANPNFNFAIANQLWGSSDSIEVVSPGAALTVRVYLKPVTKPQVVKAQLKFFFSTVTNKDYRDVTVPIVATIKA